MSDNQLEVHATLDELMQQDLRLELMNQDGLTLARGLWPFQSMGVVHKGQVALFKLMKEDATLLRGTVSEFDGAGHLQIGSTFVEPWHSIDIASFVVAIDGDERDIVNQ